MGCTTPTTIDARRLVAVDFETAWSYDHIVEIGCVELLGTKKTGRVFHCLVRPEAPNRMSPFGIHGLRASQLSGARSFKEVADEFLGFIADSTIIAHKEDYERHTLRRELERISRSALGPERFICTLKMAKAARRFEDCTLETVARQLGVYRQSRRKGFHDALTDSHMAADIYLRLSPEWSTGDALRNVRLNRRLKPPRVTASGLTLKPHKTAGRVFLDTKKKIADWWRSVDQQRGSI